MQCSTSHHGPLSWARVPASVGSGIRLDLSTWTLVDYFILFCGFWCRSRGRTRRGVERSWSRPRGCMHERNLLPGQWTVVRIAVGGGDQGGGKPHWRELTTWVHLRSGLAIGEVQVLLNPHVDSGGRGVSPASLILWTVVGITSGGGDREGACPLPAGGGTRRSLLIAPTPPGRGSGTATFSGEEGYDCRPTNSTLNRPVSLELSSILMNLPAKS
ncbi:hypothetical protein BN140_3045 [Methanoculleus bourgensis MS2]|uniref:Uncharacterized protein n=1 Tax=Methanoculleus bourgensis (strain ATCC 43281 / DSM 3045 / OCM 15 / MS2) TaxID=1201294 RepID=W6PW29_METBM|nr:hypothetical protein BN140_3045 [Methanoculleus bourgensis MS2]